MKVKDKILLFFIIFLSPFLLSAKLYLPHYISKTYKLKKTDSPRAFIIGGIHGDEVGGYISAAYLYKNLKLSKGFVSFIPFLSIKSIVRTYRYLEGVGDINDKFAFSRQNELSLPKDTLSKINHIKREIISFNPNIVLSFHTGWGFSYNNKKRCGNSITINEKKYENIDLYSPASKVLTEINNNNHLKNINYSIKILKTFSNNVTEDMNDFSTWVLKNNFPVFTIEASKNSALWRQIYNISFAALKFLKLYGLKVENSDSILNVENINRFLKSVKKKQVKFSIIKNGKKEEYICKYKERKNITVKKDDTIWVPNIEINDLGYFIIPYSEINYKNEYTFKNKLMLKIKFLNISKKKYVDYCYINFIVK